MRHLGEEIAVLDGLDNLPNYYATDNVIDASSGANYSGGSSWAEHLPLLPSNAGLADADLAQYGINAGILPPKRNVIDPSGGANYTGGSDWVPGMPLVVSNAGLAGGRPNYDGYPLENLDQFFGSTMGSDEAIYGEYGSPDGIPEYYATSGVIDASAGANYSGGSSWAEHLPLLPSNAGLAGLSGEIPPYYATSGVIDASAGANYSGGSSWAPHLPLLPSNAGLAGLDELSDSTLKMRAGAGWGVVGRVANRKKVLKTKAKITNALLALRNPNLSPKKRQGWLNLLNKNQNTLKQQRKIRFLALRRR